MREALRAASFAQMAAGELAGLRRFAYAVCGDGTRADDLVQSALERMYVAWPRAHRADNVGAYARTVLVRLAIDESRRPAARREHLVERSPEQARADHATSSADRLDLAAALDGLTAKQKAIVVLRYLEDRPVAEVADILGIAQGTVKRQCHDALAHLRDALATESSNGVSGRG